MTSDYDTACTSLLDLFKRLKLLDHTTAWRYLDVLCADGILKPGEKGHYANGRATGKASRWRFIGSTDA